MQRERESAEIVEGKQVSAHPSAQIRARARQGRAGLGLRNTVGSVPLTRPHHRNISKHSPLFHKTCFYYPA